MAASQRCMTIVKMPLTCANIGMGEPRPQILDTAGSASLNRVTSITAQQRLYERPAPGRPGPSRMRGALMTRTVCGSTPRSTAMRVSLLRSCSSAAIDAPRPLSGSHPLIAGQSLSGVRTSRKVWERPDSPHPLPRSRPGLVVESRAPGLDQHQFPSAPAALEQSGAPTNSSNPLCRQICDAYGPLFRFLAPW